MGRKSPDNTCNAETESVEPKRCERIPVGTIDPLAGASGLDCYTLVVSQRIPAVRLKRIDAILPGPGELKMVKGRILIGKPGLDGHDRGAKYVARLLRDAGYEVIYTGIRRSPEQIVAAAIQEDVDAIGLSLLSGADNVLFHRVIDLLREHGAGDILVFGGGTIPQGDIPYLEGLGVKAVFTPGTSAAEILSAVDRMFQERARAGAGRASEAGFDPGSQPADQPAGKRPTFSGHVIRPAGGLARARLAVGFTGPPGVGKSRLVDGVIGVCRQRRPEARRGRDRGGSLLANQRRCDPGRSGADDAVRHRRQGLHPVTRQPRTPGRAHTWQSSAVRIMGLVGCDVVLIETVGVGQGEVEVAGLADVVCVVLAPGLGDSVQMLKAGLLETADVFVVNKADRPGAVGLCTLLSGVLALSTGPPEDRPPIFRTSAARREGLDDLVDGIERIAAGRDTTTVDRLLESVRRDVRDAIRELARRLLESELAAAPDDAAVDRALSGHAAADDLARELLLRAAAAVERRFGSP